jgi:hypothetical protein
MKIRVELNYVLEQQPVIFDGIEELKERKVYVWEDKRTLLDSNGNLLTTQLCSQINEEPLSNSHMEFQTHIETQTPANIDDSWFEAYKSIDNPIFSLEWIVEPKVLRLSWTQLNTSLQEEKLKAKVLEQIQELGLETPPFPKLQV